MNPFYKLKDHLMLRLLAVTYAGVLLGLAVTSLSASTVEQRLGQGDAAQLSRAQHSSSNHHLHLLRRSYCKSNVLNSVVMTALLLTL